MSCTICIIYLLYFLPVQVACHCSSAKVLKRRGNGSILHAPTATCASKHLNLSCITQPPTTRNDSCKSQTAPANPLPQQKETVTLSSLGYGTNQTARDLSMLSSTSCSGRASCDTRPGCSGLYPVRFWMPLGTVPAHLRATSCTGAEAFPDWWESSSVLVGSLWLHCLLTPLKSLYSTVVPLLVPFCILHQLWTTGKYRHRPCPQEAQLLLYSSAGKNRLVIFWLSIPS